MKLLTTLLLITTYQCFGQNSTETLKKAIEYHDKNGKWMSLKGVFYFTETRPSGADRKTTLWLDNGRSWMKLNRNDDEVYEVSHDSATVVKGDKDQARGVMLRNYYLYIWGLPMKLLDEGTPMENQVSEEKVNGIVCSVVRVPYEKDIWYFYFSKASGKLMQYKFYKDEPNGKGELILLEDEYEFKGLRFPQRRSWYMLPEMKYLGTDVLIEIKSN